MGGVGKLRLCGGNFRPRRDQNPSRNPNDPFFWPYTGTGRHGRNGLIGDVLADASKITVSQFQYLRAVVPAGTKGTASAESSNKHNVVFR
jgi:hypothetical protein